MRCGCVYKDLSDPGLPEQEEKTPRPSEREQLQGGRYVGDFIDWHKPWPDYKRMESTTEGEDYWTKVRQVVRIEFDRKDFLSRMAHCERRRRHIKWSRSVELAYKQVKPLRMIGQGTTFYCLWSRSLPFSEEVEDYKADRKTWEQGQRLIAKELEVSDDD